MSFYIELKTGDALPQERKIHSGHMKIKGHQQSNYAWVCCGVVYLMDTCKCSFLVQSKQQTVQESEGSAAQHRGEERSYPYERD